MCGKSDGVQALAERLREKSQSDAEYALAERTLATSVSTSMLRMVLIARQAADADSAALIKLLISASQATMWNYTLSQLQDVREEVTDCLDEAAQHNARAAAGTSAQPKALSTALPSKELLAAALCVLKLHPDLMLLVWQSSLALALLAPLPLAVVAAGGDVSQMDGAMLQLDWARVPPLEEERLALVSAMVMPVSATSAAPACLRVRSSCCGLSCHRVAACQSIFHDSMIVWHCFFCPVETWSVV
jgi:hypothetical protein